MRTLLLLAIASFLSTIPMRAQVIPGDTPGDPGWILYGADTLALVRAADGHVWLQQNLGSTEVASIAGGSNAYGHLYQWGRWDDGHQPHTSATTQVTTLAVNNPSGLGTGSSFFYLGTDALHWWSGGSGADSWHGTVSTPTIGIDPCTALGAEWQLPSQSDWVEVLAAEDITDGATALAGNLRLPAAGSRHALSGTIINAGLFGNYWSSTPSGIYAKDLTIGEGFVNPDDDAYRGYGMSCRCLHKNLHTGIQPRDRPEFMLYPNPSTGTFTLQSSEHVLRVLVQDAVGRLVTTVPVNALLATVALPELTPGVHRLLLETEGGMFPAVLVIVK